MKFTLEITKIIVMTDKHGPDTLIITTDLPSSGWPWKDSGYLKLQCGAGTGAKYAAANFPGVEIELVD